MLRALPVGVGAALELRIDRGVPAGPAHRAARLIVVFPALLTFLPQQRAAR